MYVDRLFPLQKQEEADREYQSMFEEAEKQNESTRAAFAELSKALNPKNGNDSDKYGKRPKYFSQEEWDLYCERMDALSDSDDDPFEAKKQPHAYRTSSGKNAALQNAGQASAKDRAQSGSGTAPVECVHVECVDLTENE